MRRVGTILAAALALAGCSREKRVIDVEQPLTDPVGMSDPRIAQFAANAFQISQGGRYFSWYGCGDCHGAGKPSDLADFRKRPVPFDETYRAIASHQGYVGRIPTEQRWQLAAYVRQLPDLDPAYRKRQDIDQSGEPTGSTWKGPVR